MRYRLKRAGRDAPARVVAIAKGSSRQLCVGGSIITPAAVGCKPLFGGLSWLRQGRCQEPEAARNGNAALVRCSAWFGWPLYLSSPRLVISLEDESENGFLRPHGVCQSIN
jgi:hypothetical protein